ncbi:lipopolysaccharide heptosyltransferase I [Helicobacter sp. MIT 00-7814]|uniref:glycosyltransferase family 9 protein n=1 Tax=unclassified Helicobacter TaxID=2593540 RepID=UPI000E1EB559|nr:MULTISPECIES: glycosyltransferase family 9 protein [unclassified Helicobacter]RDU52981.1 lipopolysaccharide heptosyltransferase I [Helicobacter sp. MIT 00-7814]RDU53859.1 lipopolysaccharide heptosyltransferase I [Helicobacter sp. MIT 99-10781]
MLKIGIIRLSALGDCIVSAAFLAYLREMLESSGQKVHITWFVDSRFAGILQDSPLIDTLEIIKLKKTNLREKLALRKRLCALEKFDIVLDMQGLLKSALLGAMLKKREFIGFGFASAKESLSALFYTRRVKIGYEENILKRNGLLVLETLAESGIGKARDLCAGLAGSRESKGEDSQKLLETMLCKREKGFAYSAEARAHVEKILERNKRLIIFVLEASIPSKTYASAQFSELIDLLDEKLCGGGDFQSGLSEDSCGDFASNSTRIFGEGAQIILLSHKDTSKAREIIALSKTHKTGALRLTLTPLCGLSLDCVKALVSKADLLIGGDTGITHLAWALGRDSITLFGNTPQERFKLIGARNLTLNANTNARYKKDDFSINLIPPHDIATCAMGILKN